MAQNYRLKPAQMRKRARSEPPQSPTKNEQYTQKQEGHMALDRSPELKTACGSDGVMA